MRAGGDLLTEALGLTEALDNFPGAAALAVGLASLFFGALVQGSLGFGMGLVSIPLLGMLVPERQPQTVILVVLPLTLLMLWHERDAVRPRLITWLLVGRVLGVLPAVLVLMVVPERALQVLFAVTTLAAVGLMATNRIAIEITQRTQLFAGSLSGFIGTAAGLGGPPVALLYANQSGRTLRATLALMMLVGNTASLVGYWIGGRLTLVDLTLGGVFLIPTLVGLGAGVVVRRHLHGPSLRRAVLSVVTVSALVLLVRAVQG